jgi:hypothetical protein
LVIENRDQKSQRKSELFIPDLALDLVSAVRRCWREAKFEEETA